MCLNPAPRLEHTLMVYIGGYIQAVCVSSTGGEEELASNRTEGAAARG